MVSERTCSAERNAVLGDGVTKKNECDLTSEFDAMRQTREHSKRTYMFG